MTARRTGSRDRVLVEVLLGAVVVCVLFGVASRSFPGGVESSVADLVDGDVDERARRDRLAVVRYGGLEHGLEHGDRAAAVRGAVAAILLGDAETYDKITASGLAEPLLPLGTTTVPLVTAGMSPPVDADLGEARVRLLLEALVAERAGDRTAARRLFTRAHDSCVLTGDSERELCLRLAADGLKRVARG